MRGKERFVHPEIREGEVLFINVTQKELDMKLWGNTPDFFESIRVGNVAYTTGGTEVVPEWKPLFGKLKTTIKTDGMK